MMKMMKTAAMNYFFRVFNWNGGYDENLIRDDDDDDEDDDDDAHRRPD